MNQEQLELLLKSKKYPYHVISVSYGINNLSSEFARVMLHHENKMLIFFTSTVKSTELKAILSIDKITKVEYGAENSPVALKGINTKSANILITYISNEVEKEILFSNVNFTRTKFKELFQQLLSYVSLSENISDEGVIEL